MRLDVTSHGPVAVQSEVVEGRPGRDLISIPEAARSSRRTR